MGGMNLYRSLPIPFRRSKPTRASLEPMTLVGIELLPEIFREEVEQFLKEHSLSPAGRLRPRMGRSGNMWLVVFGPSVQDGKTGLGSSPVDALRAFNRGFGRVNGPPEEGQSIHQACASDGA